MRPTFRDPTSQSKMLSLENFPHPTCEVKKSGDCEFSYHISHMASAKWEVGLKREFPFLKYPTRARDLLSGELCELQNDINISKIHQHLAEI